MPQDPQPATRRITVDLTSSQAAALDRIMVRTGLRTSAVVRMAVDIMDRMVEAQATGGKTSIGGEMVIIPGTRAS